MPKPVQILLPLADLTAVLELQEFMPFSMLVCQLKLVLKLHIMPLLESGLRHKVEIWADGGIKSALDVMKLMLLGANRVGFGTLSMLAIGCTTCRGCHLDTCHVGIATQIDSEAQAKEHGLRRFVPRQFDLAVQWDYESIYSIWNRIKSTCCINWN